MALQAGRWIANKGVLSGQECQQAPAGSPAAPLRRSRLAGWQAGTVSRQAGRQGRPHLRKTMRLFWGMKIIVSSHTCGTAGTAGTSVTAG